MAMANASDQPDEQADNAHDPSDGVRQNQDSPPQRMSAVAADAAKGAKCEHGTDAHCNENESDNPIREQLAFGLSKEYAEYHASTSCEDNHTAFKRIKCTEHHCDTANYDEDARPKTSRVHRAIFLLAVLLKVVCILDLQSGPHNR